MRHLVLLTLAAALLACGAAPHSPAGRLTRGDTALANGDVGHAAQQYYNAWYRLRKQQKPEADAQRRRAIAGLESIVSQIAPPILKHAKALIEQRAGALAFDLVFPLFAQDPLSSRWRPKYRKDSDLIPGATPVTVAALRQVVGLDLGPDTVPLQVTLDRLAQLKTHYKRHVKGRSRRLRHLLWPIAETQLEHVDALIQGGDWNAAHEAVMALMTFGSKKLPVAERFDAARAGFARLHASSAMALADSHPYLAAVHARLALATTIENAAMTRLAHPASKPPIRIALGRLSGPCTAAARQIFSGYNGPTEGANAVLDVDFQACSARTTRRTRTVKKTVYDKRTVTRSWSEATPKYKLDYQCKKIKVCRVKAPPFRRRTWTCPGYEFRQVCGDVRVRDGFTYQKRTKRVPVSKARTVNKAVPYDVAVTDLRATATLRGLGEPIKVNLDHAIERTGTSPEKIRRDAYRGFRQRVERATRALEAHIVATASPLDAAEVAARQAIGRKAKPEHLPILAKATGARPFRLSRILKLKFERPSAEPIALPQSLQVGPPSDTPCTNAGDIEAMDRRRRLRSPFRHRWICPQQRALGYTDAAWAAEVGRWLPRVYAEPLPKP